MTTLMRSGAAAVIVILTVTHWLYCQVEAKAPSSCVAPAYFGTCDPFVPGTNIGDNGKTTQVISAWPAGPADKAGICPGDEILAAGGVLRSSHSFREFLRAIVSDQPTPVDLKIQRGTQILEFHVPRVRESTLAELSEQKYARLMYFPDGERLLTVPLDESTEELKAFGDYELQLGQRYGFKLAEGHWVPQATPEDRFKQVEEFLGHTPSARFVMRLYHLTGRGWYGPDFSALLLKDPRQLLVELIEPASPAYSAGLLPGDEILEIDGRPVAGLDQKQLSDLMLKPDEHAWQVTLRIRRGASEMTLGLKTEPTKDLGLGHFVFKASKMPGKPSPYALGAEVVTGVGPGEAVVSQVTYPSAAFRAGLLVGDRIVTVNGKPTDQLTPDQLTSELLYPASAFEITLDISRLGRRVRLRIVPLTAAEAEAEIDRKMTAHGPASALCTDAPL